MRPSVVGRVQLCDSMREPVSHVPWLQVYVVTVRVCMPPLVAQRSVPKSHVPQSPGTSAGQSDVRVQPMHVSDGTSQCVGDTQGSTPSWTEQVPPAHVSPPLQSTPSSHDTALFVCVHVWLASHASSVHGLPSSHGVAQPPPPSTGGMPMSTGGTPVSTGGRPMSTGGTPVSTGGTPVSTLPPPTSAVPASMPGPDAGITARGSEQPRSRRSSPATAQAGAA